jgi:hypothetical protein
MKRNFFTVGPFLPEIRDKTLLFTLHRQVPREVYPERPGRPQAWISTFTGPLLTTAKKWAPQTSTNWSRTSKKTLSSSGIRFGHKGTETAMCYVMNPKTMLSVWSHTKGHTQRNTQMGKSIDRKWIHGCQRLGEAVGVMPNGYSLVLGMMKVSCDQIVASDVQLVKMLKLTELYTL